MMIMNTNPGAYNNYGSVVGNIPYASYPMMSMPQMNMMNYGPVIPMMNYNPYAMPMAIPGVNPMYGPIDNFNRNLLPQNNLNMMNNNYHSVTYPILDMQQQPIKLIGPVNNMNMDLNNIPQNSSALRSNSSKHRQGNINNISTYNRNHSSHSKSKIIDANYQPYTLKDYKELTSANIVLGSLGPNIGTMEWEGKMEKMKKMTEYASQINQVKKGIKKIKNETPQDDIEKKRKRKIELSTRFKSHEYGKLVRPKSRTSEQGDIYSQDLGIIDQENEEQPLNHQIFEQAKGGNVSNNMRYEMSGSEKNEELIKLQKQRAAYEAKILEIKQSLLK